MAQAGFIHSTSSGAAPIGDDGAWRLTQVRDALATVADLIEDGAARPAPEAIGALLRALSYAVEAITFAGLARH